MEKNCYLLDRIWSMEELHVYKFTVESWGVSRELVQGCNQDGGVLLPSLPINFTIHHKYNEQLFRSSAFWHIFLEGKPRHFCQQGGLYDFRVVGDCSHFSHRPFFHWYRLLWCPSLKFFTVLECFKYLLILLIMDTS